MYDYSSNTPFSPAGILLEDDDYDKPVVLPRWQYIAEFLGRDDVQFLIPMGCLVVAVTTQSVIAIVLAGVTTGIAVYLNREILLP